MLSSWMPRRRRELVVVTGLPRSGTTVLGDLLSSGPGVAALYEPMNPQSGDRQIEAAFPLVGSNSFSEDDFEEFVERVRSLDLRLRSGVFPHERGMRRIIKRVVGGQSRASLRSARICWWKKTIVWKDPFAVLCLENFLNAKIPVVVAYRPPHAIAASYKRLGWRYGADRIGDRLREAGREERSVDSDKVSSALISPEVEDAVLLWHSAARTYLDCLSRPDPPLIVPVGDLPDSPQELLNIAFDYARLRQNWKTRAQIRHRFSGRSRNSTRPSVPTGHPHSRNRDLATVNSYWAEVLNQAEVEYIDRATADLRIQIEVSIAESILV